MASKIGEVRKIVMNTQRNFVKVRVNLKIDVQSSREGSLFMKSSMSRFRAYAVCGLPGHTELDCGNGVHSPFVKKWGDWFKADKE